MQEIFVIVLIYWKKNNFLCIYLKKQFGVYQCMCYSITGFVETLSNLFKGGTMMKVTVLVDNDTLVGMNFQVEPALSFYVE